jgi:prepilin-type N-terminal cleavage/methylation domain-containing protein
MNKRKTMKREKGFTLIELLVVIAIIAMLLAILVPGLQKVKESAKEIVCRTNIRSLSLGFRLYAETNNGKVFGYGSEGNHNLWLQQIQDQVGEIDKVRYCPSTKLNPADPALNFEWPRGLGTAKFTWIWPYGAVDSNGNPIPPGDVIEDAEHGSYGINGWLYSDTGSSNAWNTANPTNSTSIPIFADCRWVDGWPSDTDVCPAGLDLNTGGGGGMMGRFLINRHGDEINVGFIDNHQESIKLEMLWNLKWSKQFQTKGVMTRTDGSPIYRRSN